MDCRGYRGVNLRKDFVKLCRGEMPYFDEFDDDFLGDFQNCFIRHRLIQYMGCWLVWLALVVCHRSLSRKKGAAGGIKKPLPREEGQFLYDGRGSL